MLLFSVQFREVTPRRSKDLIVPRRLLGSEGRKDKIVKLVVAKLILQYCAAVLGEIIRDTRYSPGIPYDKSVIVDRVARGVAVVIMHKTCSIPLSVIRAA